MSLPCQIEDCSSLSPGRTWPPAVPRRTSARSRNATAEADVSRMVTVVARSAPSGPARRTVAALTETPVRGSVCSAFSRAYWLMMPCGRPSDLAKLVTS